MANMINIIVFRIFKMMDLVLKYTVYIQQKKGKLEFTGFDLEFENLHGEFR